MSGQVEFLVDDTHVCPDFVRYTKGTRAKILEEKTRLADGRWWHYKLKVATPNTEQNKLSGIVLVTKDKIKKLRSK